ncbi:MAG: hypothetical protein JW893_03250 [Candidatus Omnitrophica bacterium]|nr:hypothetical protein [Candidatus Omnitrophota bacterium]
MVKKSVLISLIVMVPFFLTAINIPNLLAAETEVGLSNDDLLETISRSAFDYFVYERNKKTGLVKDRAHNFRRGAQSSQASIASTGFALTAYAVGVERNWIDYGTARQITEQTLSFFLQFADQERGFFYHFLEPETGRRAYRSELSPIDTALFLAGALFAAEYYDDVTIRDLAVRIYERVDWDWMLHGGETFALAWSPEEGFDKRRWDHYSELMIMYLLAVGSPTHPIPASSWHAIARPVGSYGGYRLIQMPPLFTHQYSHIWIDFRDQHDDYADYFQNSVNASLANRAFVIDQAARYESYGPNSWGLTACDGPVGYRAYGAPPGWANHDGTIAPTGCGASIVFTPKESIACLRYLYENLGDRLWGNYGFSDSFNLDKSWFGSDVIGIDQGALLLMIENYRSGFIWRVMKENRSLQFAMDQVGFQRGTINLPWPDPPVYQAPYVAGTLEIDGYLNDWPNREAVVLQVSKNKETGAIQDDEDLNGKFWFAWDEHALYFSAKVVDDNIVVRKTGRNIWQDDLVELFIDPDGDGLQWEGEQDFQIGFRVHEDDEGVETWSWFRRGEDPQANAYVSARGYVAENNYIVEGAIRWDYLGVRPFSERELRLSPAIHDIDRDRSQGKLNWFFRNEDKLQNFALGKIILEKPVGESNLIKEKSEEVDWKKF